MHKIPVIRLYFPLDALHVSDYISPSSGETFCKLYIAIGICRYMPVPHVWLLCGYSNNFVHLVGSYTHYSARYDETVDNRACADTALLL